MPIRNDFSVPDQAWKGGPEESTSEGCSNCGGGDEETLDTYYTTCLCDKCATRERLQSIIWDMERTMGANGYAYHKLSLKHKDLLRGKDPEFVVIPRCLAKAYSQMYVKVRWLMRRAPAWEFSDRSIYKDMSKLWDAVGVIVGNKYFWKRGKQCKLELEKQG